MSELLLFAPASTHRPARSLVTAAGHSPGAEAASSASTFALSGAAWAKLAALVRTSQARADAARAQTTPTPGRRSVVTAGGSLAQVMEAALAAVAAPCESVELQDTWWALIDAARDWDDRVKPSFQAMAGDIISFADVTAARHYGRLAELLRPLQGRAPTKAEADACVTVLDRLVQAAQDRARRAVKLNSQIGPFADAAHRFGQAFARHERNPPIRVMLPGVPFLCLSYGDDNLACAGDIRRQDERHWWILDFQPQSGAYTFTSATSPDRVLVVDQNPQLITLANSAPVFLISEAPRPRLEARAAVTNQAAALFYVPPHDGLYIQNVSYPGFTLDCVGNDFWGEGTPVLCFRKDGGVNQRWAFDPPPRSPREIAFHDVVAPSGALAEQIGRIRPLQGDWAAIADDLRAGVGRVLGCLERGEPFTLGQRIEEVLEAWRRLALEAAAASSAIDR